MGIRKQDPAMPVYGQTLSCEGHEWTLHWNILFPLALPQADRTTDEVGAGATLDTDAESGGGDPCMQTRSRHASVVERSSSESEDDVRYTGVPEVEVIIDDSDNDIQPRNGPVIPLRPSAEELSSDDEIPEQENDVPQLRWSTRNKQLPGRFRNGTYIMYPRQFPHHSGRTSSMCYGVIFLRDVRRSMTVCYEMLISCSHS